MVNKFTHETIDKSVEELKEVTAGSQPPYLHMMNFAHVTQCPELQQFLIEASQVQCPHFIYGIILGLLIVKNQEEYNTTQELEKMFKLEKTK